MPRPTAPARTAPPSNMSATRWRISLARSADVDVRMHLNAEWPQLTWPHESEGRRRAAWMTQRYSETTGEGEAVRHVVVDALEGCRRLDVRDRASGRVDPGLVDEQVEGDDEHARDGGDPQALDGNHHAEQVSRPRKGRRQVFLQGAE